jgi:ubiquitin-protein ligase
VINKLESPFENAKIKVKVSFTEEYPFKAPEIRFDPPIYHGNVDQLTGVPCLAILKTDNWRPTCMLSHVVEELIEMIQQPRVNEPIVICFK